MQICTGEAPRRGFLRALKAPDDAPAEIAQLIVRCLDSEPGERPDASELLAVLKPHEQTKARRGSARGTPRTGPGS